MLSARAAAWAGSLSAIVACSSVETPEDTSASVSSSASSGGASSTGPGGGSPGPEFPPPETAQYLALPCDDDIPCGPGGHCIRATDDAPLGGGPAGGYCSRPCQEDWECPGSYSRCFKDAGTGDGSCFLGCEPGPLSFELGKPLQDDKCQGREDVRCTEPLTFPPSSFPPSASCLPTCGKDDQCPAGRWCDPKDRVCVTNPHRGLPSGEKCQVDEDCAGYCRPLTPDPDVGICASDCVLGGEVVTSNDCGGIDEGLCIIIWYQYGAGDGGGCVPACSSHDDCAHPTYWCASILGPGQPGHCVSGIPSCSSGRCDDGTCTETIYGKRCLDPQYPLGSATPGTGGATGAGGSGGG
jgi:hypothetical protein